MSVHTPLRAFTSANPGIGGATLARNPNAFRFGLPFANLLERAIGSKGLEARGGSFQLGTQQRGTGFPTKQNPFGSQLFTVSQFELDFAKESSRLRSDFISGSVEREFGLQGITSQTTAGGKPIPGQVQARTPTKQQLAGIGKSFISPTQRALRGLPTGPQSAQSQASRQPNPTVISGQGIRRRRLGRGGGSPTLLTSDADLGGEETTLG